MNWQQQVKTFFAFIYAILIYGLLIIDFALRVLIISSQASLADGPRGFRAYSGCATFARRIKPTRAEVMRMKRSPRLCALFYF